MTTPRWLLVLLRRLAPPGRVDDLLGDLEEAHRARLQRRSRPVAHLGTALEALDMAWVLVRQRLRRDGTANGGSGVGASAVLIDARHALRGLRRGTGPLVVSVLSLSLGIAAVATMLNVIDAIDVRPLPFRDADELVEVSEVNPAGPFRPGRVAPGVYREWRERVRSTASLAAASPIVVSFREIGGTFDAARVTEDFLTTLGVRPRMGRTFTAEEVRREARVAVISHDLWRSRFGGDPGAVGRTVSLSWAGEYRSVPAEPYTVVGVLPDGVRYPRGARVWIPAAGGFGDSRRDRFLTVIGRLEEGVSPELARAEFETITSRSAATDRESGGGRVPAVVSLRDAMRATAEERGAATRFSLLGVAGFVLLLSVLNVTGVFLARTATESRELRVRLALGAPRSRLATHLLTQSLALAAAAGLVGVGMAHGFVEVVSARLRVAESGAALVLDGRFVLLAALLSLLTGLLVSLLPLARLGRLEHRGVLGAPSARGTGIARTGGVRKAMVVGQVALAVVLLSGAGLLSVEFLRLATSDTGFDPEGLLVASLPIRMAESPEASVAEARRVEGRVARLGEVSSAALGALPGEGYSYRLESGDTLRAARRPTSYRVSPGYFATLRIGLTAGREFFPTDGEDSAPVAVVSRRAAELWWPDRDPVGRIVYMAARDGAEEPVRVVGVAEDERVMRSLTSEIRPVLYRPFEQLTHERRRVRVFARTDGRPEAALGGVRRVIEETRGGTGWRGEAVVTMEGMLGDTLARQRFRTWALSLFSLVALLLAAMGIYGVVATMVVQRKAEIGVRIALGARRGQVLALVSRQGAVLAGLGFALGLAGSVATTRILQSLLVNPAGLDVRIPLAAGVVLAGAVLLACYLPARRAARIDPAPLLHDA